MMFLSLLTIPRLAHGFGYGSTYYRNLRCMKLSEILKLHSSYRELQESSNCYKINKYKTETDSCAGILKLKHATAQYCALQDWKPLDHGLPYFPFARSLKGTLVYKRTFFAALARSLQYTYSTIAPPTLHCFRHPMRNVLTVPQLPKTN